MDRPKWTTPSPRTRPSSQPMSSEYVAHIRQSRPDSGLGFHIKVLKPIPSSFESGLEQVAPPPWRPFRQKSTCITQWTLGPHVVQIWSHKTLELLRGRETGVISIFTTRSVRFKALLVQELAGKVWKLGRFRTKLVPNHLFLAGAGSGDGNNADLRPRFKNDRTSLIN